MSNSRPSLVPWLFFTFERCHRMLGNFTIAPRLSIPTQDIGENATLILYIYVPVIQQGYIYLRPVSHLEDPQAIDVFGPALDFSSLYGLEAVIYAG